MKAGLFFGSFNPIHIGHLAIANYMVEFTDLDQFWFIISPHNPLKEKKSLLNDHHRYDMVTMAIQGDERFRASDIEFRMPQPSYTIDTLTYLKEKNPDHEYVLIVGSDNIDSFHKWKNYDMILEEYRIYVYPRPKSAQSMLYNLPNVKQVPAPLMDISSSFIRNAIQYGKDIRHFLPPKVYQYILDMHFYEK